MVSAIRYPHMVNRYLRGRRSIARLLSGVAVLLLVVVAHRYAFGLGSIAYAMYGPFTVAYGKLRPRTPGAAGSPAVAPGAATAATPGAPPLPPSPAPR
jgi:hypothetical protein